MANVEMIVRLKVPDNVAITAFNTLKRMNYTALKKLERADYYKFDVSGNIAQFKEKICKTDIIINPNKHEYSFNLNGTINEKNDGKNNGKAIKIKMAKINLLVQDLDNSLGLLLTLKERLGFSNIIKLEKGVLWTMYFEPKFSPIEDWRKFCNDNQRTKQNDAKVQGLSTELIKIPPFYERRNFYSRDAEKIAEDIAKNLLMNENFQRYVVLK
ncbi:hypothetical protein HYX01_03800 [Candidatus Woesearchaeota archaeon]|nr:hypothetical protein [Candidatus Woesearchaeota archaeon]